jgi:hypothetical protein
MNSQTYKPDQTVQHDRLGIGVVLQTEGVGNDAKIQVNFKEHGIKWLMLAHVELELVSTENKPQSKKPSSPKLTIVKNDNSVKNTIETQIVENQTNNTTNNTHIAKQINHFEKKQRLEPVKRLSPEEGGLTDEQFIQIDEITEKIILLEEIAGLKTSWGKIRTNIKRAAKATHLVTIKACNFHLVEAYFKETIGRLNKHPRVKELRNDKLEYAHQRFKELGVSKAKRYEYQYLKYGKESMAIFEVWEIADYCEYLKQPNPTFDINENWQPSEPNNVSKAQSTKPVNNVVKLPKNPF